MKHTMQNIWDADLNVFMHLLKIVCNKLKKKPTNY